MNQQDKIELADQILNLLNYKSNDKSITPASIGSLNSPQGVLGFKIAPIGTPVFEEGDRYYIYLETLDGKNNHKLSYFKYSLKKSIDFL